MLFRSNDFFSCSGVSFTDEKLSGENDNIGVRHTISVMTGMALMRLKSHKSIMSVIMVNITHPGNVIASIAGMVVVSGLIFPPYAATIVITAKMIFISSITTFRFRFIVCVTGILLCKINNSIANPLSGDCLSFAV